MAPINRLASPVMRMAVQKRSFGIMQQVRHQLRSFEPHPFERYPTTVSAAKADWGRQFKKLGNSAMFFFPGMAFVLGWPLLAELVLDGHMGDL